MPIPAIVTALAPGLLEAAGKLIDRLFPDPEQAAKAKLALMQAEGQQALAEMQLTVAAGVAEAQSGDKWTSRARPSFLYCMYALVMASVPMGLAYAFAPSTAPLIAAGMQSWLAAIPSELWNVFAVCFSVYTGGRTIEKWRGVAK